MKVVDPHVHLWDLDAVALPWLMPAGEAYSGDNRRLPRRFLPADLIAQARADDIELLKLVNVEANPADPLAETRWLQTLADDGGFPQAIVAAIDFSQPDAAARLAAHAQSANLRGVRQILNVHADPRYDYVGRHYMTESAWRTQFGTLALLNLSFDLQIYPSQAPLAAELAARHPQIAFIVNHAGMCVDRDARGRREWRDGLRALAACANVSIKISGLAMFDHDWTVDSLRPYVLETIDAFGAARCMFASNFPIDGLHSSCGALWHAYADIVAGASSAERHALFVGNAERCYRI
ncbi:amidohydrolase family protein [Solimonas terrae]|uniref:Amidohydrolase family protein n=1 Tax=Solimonas terrae TaxID=1396819 RepID=A0A6M2BPT7_9GAMM|nr:amidohydrolase family protein [Solimonas terrae]NGY04251.1 amidohydrolase family protein [Solimonas terrae]